EATQYLIDAGVDVNAKESAHGQTALMFAAAAGRTEAARMLLAKGADSSITTKVIDLAALTAAPGEEALQQNREQRACQPGSGPSRQATAQAVRISRPR